MLTFPAVRLASPRNEKRTVMPRRRRNSDLRTREYLTEAEVERLIEAAKDNRWGHRDSTMLLIAFRHGLRASELVDLRWEQIDLENAILHVRRVQQGTPATHPLTGRELRALRRLQREQEPKIALRLCKRTWRSVLKPGLSGDGGAGGQGRRLRHEDSPAHAAPRLWLQARERWSRYPHDPGVSRPQVDSTYGALHRAGADAI